MNSNVVRMKLKETALRIETLKSRFDYIIENGKLEEHGGFFPGQSSPGVMSPFFDLSENDKLEFMYFLATNWKETDNEYIFMYHLENVDSVISSYYHCLITGDVEIDLEVVKNFSEACQMVIDTIGNIRAKL